MHEKLSRLLDIWQERQVYSAEWIAETRAAAGIKLLEYVFVLLSDLPTQSQSTTHAAAKPSSPVSVSPGKSPRKRRHSEDKEVIQLGTQVCF
jgi:hypothetical protein